MLQNMCVKICIVFLLPPILLNVIDSPKRYHFFSLTTKAELVYSSVFQKHYLECSDRGNRIEGVDCPHDVSGAYIELESAIILPMDESFVASGDSVYMRFYATEGDSFIATVSERRTKYLMQPKFKEILDGCFVWPVAEVLLPLTKKAPFIKYNDLLPLVYLQESTPFLIHCRPSRVSKLSVPRTIQGYQFIFRANADITLNFKFYQKQGHLFQEIGYQGNLEKESYTSFLIDWDGKINEKPAPEGEYTIKLTGEATVGPMHELLEIQCFFYHKPNLL